MDNGQPMRYAIYTRHSSDLQRRQTCQSQTRPIIPRSSAQFKEPAQRLCAHGAIPAKHV
jgi:hypothetical protein